MKFTKFYNIKVYFKINLLVYFKMKAFFILTLRPSENNLNFVREFLKKDTDILPIIIVDDNDYIPPKDLENYILQVDDKTCKQSGFYNINFVIKKEVTSWDKVMYLLCTKMKQIKFCWIVEDDVFVPSVDSVIRMTQKYSKYDIVTASNYINYNENINDLEYENVKSMHLWRHWKKVPKNMYSKASGTKVSVKGWARSMVCAIGMSHRLIKEVIKYVNKFHRLEFLEFFFNTLAYRARLKYITPRELYTITWRYKFTDEEIIKMKYNWFHPIKDQNRQVSLRNPKTEF